MFAFKFARDSAAAQCGEARPHRHSYKRMRLRLNGSRRSLDENNQNLIVSERHSHSALCGGKAASGAPAAFWSVAFCVLLSAFCLLPTAFTPSLTVRLLPSAFSQHEMPQPTGRSEEHTSELQ